MPVKKKPAAKKKTAKKTRGPNKPKVAPIDEAPENVEQPASVATTKGLSSVMDSINGKHGKGAIVRLNSDVKIDIGRISTGHYELDRILGGDDVNGYGIGRGRIIEIYGWESCLVGDTYVKYNVVSLDGKVQNCKGGTIENLYYRFNGIEREGKGYYKRPETVQAKFTAPSINDEDRIFQNDIVDVVKTGIKECYEVVTTSGQVIQTTGDHKFYTGTSYKKLSQLKVGDTVQIHNGTHFKVDSPKTSHDRKYLYVKYHPVAGVKEVEGGKYKYYRLRNSRATVEAYLNGVTLADYIDYMNTHDESNWNAITIPRWQHVHHKDENHLNDKLENLVVISSQEHGKGHAIERHNNFRFICVDDSIESITPVGKKQTFDIKMTAPANNFVANGFVVHNSGKTTTAYQIMAQAQLMGLEVAFIDVEHATDREYAQLCGVDTDKLWFSQPDGAEQSMDILETLVKSREIGLVVLDAVAAMATKAELEGEVGDSHVGQLSRLMSQELKRINPHIMKSNTAVILINQLREKIGGMGHGEQKTTPGGRAIKFYAGQRLEITKVGAMQPITIKGEPTIPGQKVKIKTIKNKIGPALRTIQTDLLYPIEFANGKIQKPGFDGVGSLIDAAIDKGVMSGGGAKSYVFPDGNSVKGRQNAREYLIGKPALMDKIFKKVAS